MTYNLFRGGGIAALAHVATNNDASPLLQCTFQVKCKDSSHATLSLQHATHVHGFTEAQSFYFIYDADNLVPATTTCMTAKRTLTQLESDHIARNQVPEVRALSLNLKKPCAILCPNVPGSIAPKASHEGSFGQLVQLAKATEITVLFDWKWLHRSQHGPFLTIVSQPETFSGFPINEKNLKERRLEDWSVFSPIEEHCEQPNDPPPYADVSRKRTRRSSSSPPQSPPSKRILYIPEGSPTEKATTIPTSSRRSSSTIVGESPHSRHSPLPEPTHIHSGLEQTMKKMMQQMFPEMLDQFIDSYKPRSVSPSPPCPPLSNPIPTKASSISQSLNLRSSLRALLSARATVYFEKKLITICDNTVYDAQQLRVAADEEHIQALEDQKLDLQTKKEDLLEDLQEDIDRMVDEKLQDLDITIAEYMEEAEERVERAVNNKLDKCLNRKWVPEVAPYSVEISNRKTKRNGRAAGDRKRYRCRTRGR